ncbi:hypothetical protein Anacy_2231 [Anabaena cylindrica PCC 7122]|uniref:Uncharacterized protein n=1 Tax=Anabaena cylindrica (strain ATCC 27899 / PCC 7122) TaxID=272123 RepID=K9ZEU4_ANACC|nr:hypothetical protein Anacy_2231 [Anabaena cylindrica PCC 7122]BAY05352.1 hypothetical protein NIES19_46230 [Anabaena cylindrica PCC 7122]
MTIFNTNLLSWLAIMKDVMPWEIAQRLVESAAIVRFLTNPGYYLLVIILRFYYDMMRINLYKAFYATSKIRSKY